MTDDDLPRDAWLREALRHAPDAEAGPPPKLNETILRMGRAAVAPRAERKVSAAAPMPAPTSGGLTETLQSWWSWLARPPVAAGFAGLMVATVVGVMWWDRPLEEALPPREETVAAAPPSEATAPAAAPTPAPAGPPEAAKQAADAAATAAADAPARKTVPAALAAAPPAAPTPTVMAENAARERESAERREAALARKATAAPPPAADAAAPGALAGRAVTQSAASAAPASAIETPSLSNLRFEIRRSPDLWTWQRDDGDARPMDDAMQDWIAQADRTARPSWQHGATGPDSSTTTLRFTRGGVVRAVLRLGPSGMRLTRGGRTESVDLSRGAVNSLQSSLDALGP